MTSRRSSSGSRGAPPESLLSWEEEFNRTWLSDKSLVSTLDREYICPALLAHRSLPAHHAPNVAPASAVMLVEHVQRFGKEQYWFWCTAALCLLAELLLVAERGTTWKGGILNAHIAAMAEPLRRLRNSCFHPAHQADSGSGPPPILTLIEWFESNNELRLAASLKPNWALLAQRPIASFALRRMDLVGRMYVQLLQSRAPRS